jgi:hypothetical protein
MTDEDWPTPGPDPPVPLWPEYDQLREAVDTFLAHDPPNPRYETIWRALGPLVAEYLQEQFVAGWHLSEPADKACLARLIDGPDECPHTLDSPDDPHAPPHSPPSSDHATLWLDEDGEPVVCGMHVYPGNINALDDPTATGSTFYEVFEFAAEYGLDCQALPISWYNPGRTIHLVLYPPERY